MGFTMASRPTTAFFARVSPENYPRQCLLFSARCAPTSTSTTTRTGLRTDVCARFFPVWFPVTMIFYFRYVFTVIYNYCIYFCVNSIDESTVIFITSTRYNRFYFYSRSNFSYQFVSTSFSLFLSTRDFATPISFYPVAAILELRASN